MKKSNKKKITATCHKSSYDTRRKITFTPFFHLVPFQEESQRHVSSLSRRPRPANHSKILITNWGSGRLLSSLASRGKSSLWAEDSLLSNMLQCQVLAPFVPRIMKSHFSSTKLAPRSQPRACEEASPELWDSSRFIALSSSNQSSLARTYSL